VSRCHSVGLDSAILQVSVIFHQKLALLFEEFVDIFERIAQQKFVTGFMEGVEESDKLLLLVLAADV
jgi:hypothetical protein